MTIAPRATMLPPSSEEVRAELQGELDAVHRAGDALCHLIGMTSTWGAVRWETGATGETLVPTYRIVVTGHVPDEELIDLLVQRLTRQGWCGAVLSHEPILRLDAHRAAFTMRLTAEASTVRLTVTSGPVAWGGRVGGKVGRMVPTHLTPRETETS